MKKRAHELNREFLTEEVQMTSKYTKKCSNFPWCKRDANQNNIDFISPPLEWPYSRAVTTTNAGEDVTEQEPLYTVGGNAN
jgi:hypothetical protein